MIEYKNKITTKLFWSICGFCAALFIYNLAGRFTHSFLIAIIAATATLIWFAYKIYYLDNISIVLTDDNHLLIKRFTKVINAIDISKYNWSEYSKYSNTKNSEDQDIYYVDKVTGIEESIDATNFSSEAYEDILEKLGAKNIQEEPIKIVTTKK